MKKKSIKVISGGAILAAAVSDLLASNSFADQSLASGINNSSAVYNSALAGTQASVFANEAGKHDCKGKNECKGQGGCNSGDNGCKGKNSCKGKGGCASNGHDH